MWRSGTGNAFYIQQTTFVLNCHIINLFYSSSIFHPMFHLSADSMHFSQITLWVGVLSLLQAATARPAIGGSPQQSSQSVRRQSGETNGPGGTTGLGGTRAAAIASTDTVNTLTGEMTSNTNGTETQTFPNTTNVSPGANGSLHYLGSSLPRLQSQSPILPPSKSGIITSHSAAT